MRDLFALAKFLVSVCAALRLESHRARFHNWPDNVLIIQRSSVAGAYSCPHSWASLLLPFFPFPPFPSPAFLFPPLSFPLLSYPIPFSPLPSPLLRSSGRGPGRALKLPQWVWAESYRQTVFLVNCRLKIAPVVAMVLRRFTRDTSTWSIVKTQYVTLYVNHNIPSIVQWDPKVSVLLWFERRWRRVKDTR